MTHRLREVTKHPDGMWGTPGATIEAGETYVAGKERNKHRSKRGKKQIGHVGKQMVLSPDVPGELTKHKVVLRANLIDLLRHIVARGKCLKLPDF